MKHQIVIFGASGDLTIKKLMPHIAKLNDPSIEIVAYTRSILDTSYVEKLKQYHNYDEKFLSQIIYIQGHYHDLSSLVPITNDNTLLYFAVPPSVYGDLLKEATRLRYKAIGVEKPFGIDFNSFQMLSCFNDTRIHFIDHYLLKNLSIIFPSIADQNKSLYQNLSNKTIHSVEAKFHESILSEGRAFFDKTGIIKDVVQNHLTEIIATIICCRDCQNNHSANKNCCKEFQNNNLLESEKRANIIKKMSIVENSGVFGQYEGYCEEIGSFSKTETFGAFLMKVNTDSWENVPFFLSAGKGLSEKTTEVCFNIKEDEFSTIVESLGTAELKDVIKKSKLKKLKLIYKFAPTSEIFLSAKFTDSYENYSIFTNSQIVEKIDKIFGKKRGYQIIFDSLVYSKEFPNASHEEVFEMWRVYENILKNSPSTFIYKPGVKFPKEAVEKYKEYINYE